MTPAKFSLKENSDGSCDVIVTKTGQILKRSGVRLTHLSKDEAEKWLMLLAIWERIERRRLARSGKGPE